MIKKSVIAVVVALLSTGTLFAGSLTKGLEITGGKNTFALLALERSDRLDAEEGVIRLQVSVREAQELKGYGFVLTFDPSRYEFVETREVQQGLLGSGDGSLFVSSNKSPGEVTVGGMKVDGTSADGGGALVEFVFRSTEDPVVGDFQVAEGVLVDLAGQIDQIHNIEVANLSLRPEDFGLSQNTPNPFNPSTTIDYQMPEPGEVRLTVYNLLGQEVRTLIDGQLDAGYHTIVWDGTDDSGRQVASGVYVYRMSAGAFSAVRRMMLLK